MWAKVNDVPDEVNLNEWGFIYSNGNINRYCAVVVGAVPFKREEEVSTKHCMIEQGYPYSREETIAETGLPATMFPEECPFELSEILDYRFFPQTDHK